LDNPRKIEEIKMGLISKDSGGGGNFEPLPMGTHIARCVSVVDLGTQESVHGPKEKVYLGFEVAAVRVEWEKDGQQHEGPALIGSTYNNTINERAILGQHLVSWRGKAFTEEERQGFDLFTVVGAPCLISVTHNIKGGITYANINGIMRLPKGMTCPPAETDLIAYSPMDQAVAANIGKLPDWLQKKVRIGYQIAEGSFQVGSALIAQQQAGGPIAPGQPAPTIAQASQAASMHPPQTAAEAMEAAMAAQTQPQTQAPPPIEDDFDDSIPF
jgi:hypothetical protein